MGAYDKIKDLTKAELESQLRSDQKLLDAAFKDYCQPTPKLADSLVSAVDETRVVMFQQIIAHPHLPQCESFMLAFDTMCRVIDLVVVPVATTSLRTSPVLPDLCAAIRSELVRMRNITLPQQYEKILESPAIRSVVDHIEMSMLHSMEVPDGKLD